MLPNSRAMIHQPLIQGGLTGQASDIEIHAREMLDLKKALTEIYVKHTGRPFEDLTNLMDRDHFLRAQQAKDLGLVDHIVEFRKDIKTEKEP